MNAGIVPTPAAMLKDANIQDPEECTIKSVVVVGWHAQTRLGVVFSQQSVGSALHTIPLSLRGGPFLLSQESRGPTRQSLNIVAQRKYGAV